MSEQFIKIYDWMYDLDLTKTEFLVYALVYSLTESTGGCLGQKYIQDRLHLTKDWTSKTIVKLKDKGLIQVEETGNCYRPKRYIAVYDTSAILHSSAIQHSSATAVYDTSATAVSDTSATHLYIDKNTYKNTYKNTSGDYSEILDELGIEKLPDLIEAVDAFVEHRKKLKKPLTRRALKLNLKKAQDLTDGAVYGIIGLLDVAIEKGWQGIYKPKEEPKRYEQEPDEDFFEGID